ncbi:hypothetical protein Q1695_011704 [Nippostrongylus brasiliensis]|nr:hypothetical protein Q1695_011704 [Nippostrongylus brasiliensis]
MSKAEGKATCTTCAKEFHPNSISRHMRRQHGVSNSVDGNKNVKNRVECPKCQEKFVDHVEFVHHCSYEHDNHELQGTSHDYTMIEEMFESKESFQEWLDSMCANSCTTFVTRNCRQVERGRVVYLRCSRAGIYRSEGNNRRIRQSRKGTKFCTAHVTVFEDEYGIVRVKGCFGHIGHDLDAAILRSDGTAVGMAQDQEYRKELWTKGSYKATIINAKMEALVKMHTQESKEVLEKLVDSLTALSELNIECLRKAKVLKRDVDERDHRKE